jgi:O-antigen/teichoic acid export membrane protein
VSGTAARREESAAARGARWIAVATVSVGLSNYGYALLLTHLLSAAEYSEFAAGQGLILWAMNVATVSVPWVLAQALSRATSAGEAGAAIRFAKLTSATSGILAAAVVGLIAKQFASSTTAIVVSMSTFLLFVGTTTTGWLQGRKRMRKLAFLYIAENILKNCTGVLLVVVARAGEAGALAAFGIGAFAMLGFWPRTPRGASGFARTEVTSRHLWRHALATASAQGLVSLFIAIDAVMVALLHANPAMAASYQASAALSRIPLYLAGAIATAVFPSLSGSRQGTADAIAARAVRMYAAAALPIAIVLATVPKPVVALVFPAQYSAMGTLLRYTAITGLAAGGISLMTAFFQAADDYSCLRWLGAGLAAYTAALFAGWRIDGIDGLAVGGAIGATAAMAVMAYRVARRQDGRALARIPLVVPFVSAVALTALRSYPYVWLAVAILVGMQAVRGFLRPGARHRRGPDWANLRSRSQGRATGAAGDLAAVGPVYGGRAGQLVPLGGADLAQVEHPAAPGLDVQVRHRSAAGVQDPRRGRPPT